MFQVKYGKLFHLLFEENKPCVTRYPVVQLGENEVELVVRRFNGSMNSIQVSYSTLPLNGITRDGGILLNPAIEGTDFVKAVGVLTFADGQVIV